MSKSDFLKQPVKAIDLEKIKSIEDLIENFKLSSIQSRNIARCSMVYENMLKDKQRPTIILGMAGALIAGGLRKVIRDMIKYGIVDVIVSIGAIPYQDFYQSRGYKHYQCSPIIDDLKLREHFLDRIYDTIVDEEKFRETDAFISKIAEKLPPREYSSREFMAILGENAKDENSILYTAKKYNVPFFCPTIHDSSIGIGLTQLYVKSKKQKKKCMTINLIRDNWELTQIKIKSKKTGVIYLGGGVPKNYIQQTEVIAETLGHNCGGHNYAIQLTMDGPQWGGLSGCTFEEAQSWGKIAKDAKKAVAYVETTVGLPLIVGYVLQKGIWKNRKRLRFEWNNSELVNSQRFCNFFI